MEHFGSTFFVEKGKAPAMKIKERQDKNQKEKNG